MCLFVMTSPSLLTKKTVSPVKCNTSWVVGKDGDD
jgi:hypothetical protein